MILGLFGGSFNPPHIGHVCLARKALNDLALDKLIWMPGGDPPHRTLPPGTPAEEHRLAMSRLAAEGLPKTEVSDFELRGGARYTFDTVTALLDSYEPDKLWLLMGSDMYGSFHTWHRADELRALCGIYSVPRESLPVSSTEVRSLLAEGRGEDKLPPAIWRYIRREGLYA